MTVIGESAQFDIPKRWDDLLRSLSELAEEIVFADPRSSGPRQQAEGLRYLTRMLVAGVLSQVEGHDPAYPRLYSASSAWLPWGANNPDCNYIFALCDGAHSYRLSGMRGSVYLFDVEVWQGDMAYPETSHNFGGVGHQYGSEIINDLAVDARGRFEVVLSREREDGNWLAIPEGLSFLVIRQMFNDWETEQPAEVQIERVGALYPPPAPTAAVFDEQLRLLNEWLYCTRGFAKAALMQAFSGEPNTFSFQPFVYGKEERTARDAAKAGQYDGTDNFYYRHLVMGCGSYACRPDEAVIIETPAPPTDYWNFYLGNHYFEAYNYDIRQTSLNARQGVLDADGKFRAVISHTDPGVPNWLDPVGNEIGILFGRYFRPRHKSEVTVTVVPLATLRDHLPPSTPVVTPEQRSSIVRGRELAVRRRSCDV